MLKKSITSLLLAASLMAGCYRAAAGVSDLPVRSVNGHNYHTYVVEPKETVYSLCHKLEITKEELVRYNPSVADGLRAGMTLFFPAAEGAVITPANASAHGVIMITHNVEKGQTIYGIAMKYGISTDELIAQNPIVREGLKAGQQLHLTVPTAASATIPSGSQTGQFSVSKSDTAPRTGAIGYIVKKKETFYSIARANNLSVAELEAANPGITVLKEGQVLSIPVPGVAVVPTEDAAPDGTMHHAPSTTLSVSVDSLSRPADTVAARPLSVAVVLPFMLDEENLSKSTKRYTEFYKGFLLAVDSLRNNNAPIHINAYDTEGSIDKVREIVESPGFADNRFVIAPDNAEQLAILGAFGREHGQKVMNLFLVRDESYLANDAVMQGNIPSQIMLDKAADALAERVLYSVPVFLNVVGGANDKTDFTNALKKRLDAKGKPYKTIDVEGKLTAVELKKQFPADGSYSFIPTSARQSDVNKLLPAIIEWRDEVLMPAVKVIGYPEWTTFRGETLENMHNVNTIVYSRFFTDDENIRTHRVEEAYKRWYGTRMENAVPRQGLLGFDVGMFAISYLNNPAARYDGAQNGFSFPSSDTGNWNHVLYLINYRPGGLIEKINL